MALDCGVKIHLMFPYQAKTLYNVLLCQYMLSIVLTFARNKFIILLLQSNSGKMTISVLHVSLHVLHVLPEINLLLLLQLN